MSIKDFLGNENIRLLACKPQDQLTEVVRLMVENGVNGIAVVEENNKLAGILTDHDIMRALDANGGVLGKACVSEWMVDEVVTCLPETKLTEALKIMGSHNIRHLVVADGPTALAVVGIRSILNKIHEHDELEIKVLRDIAVAARASAAA